MVKAHQLAGFPTPAGPVTAAALLGIGRSNGAAQGQAAPLTAEGLAAIRATAHLPRRGRGGGPETAAFARRRGLVDVAIASVIRDGLLRVSETVALAWADVAPAPDGSGVATVRRSKTDSESQGQAVYLGEAAMTALAAIRPADVDEAAPIFGLSVRHLPRRIQAMARAAGLGEGFSGHSGRVGMAQDLAAGGAELPALMVAGQWQSPRMPARYTAAGVPPVGGSRPGKASPGPGCGRQVSPGEGRQLAAARVTIKAVLRFPSIGGLWPNLAQGSL